MRLLTVFLSLIVFNVNAQYVSIPDPKFKLALLSNSAININNNFEIETSEAAQFTGQLDVSYKGISNLTGIKAFTKLTNLNANSNNLTQLDVSGIFTLSGLSANHNQLTTVNYSGIHYLSSVDVSYNKLTTVDIPINLYSLDASNNLLTSITINASNQTLKYLKLPNNQLSTLNLPSYPKLFDVDLSNNLLQSLDFTSQTTINKINVHDNELTSLLLPVSPYLDYISAYKNQLTTLDASNCAALVGLTVSYNKLTGISLPTTSKLYSLILIGNLLESLDLSNQKELGSLGIDNNHNLTELDLSKNIKLKILQANNNSFTSFDFSNHKDLLDVQLEDNKLTNLNLANGANTSLQSAKFKNNAALTCIKVDDATYSNTNWTSFKDATTNYSTTCALTDLNNETSPIEFKLSPNPVTQGSFTINNLTIGSSIMIIDQTGKTLLNESANASSITVNTGGPCWRELVARASYLYKINFQYSFASTIINCTTVLPMLWFIYKS